MIKNWIRFVSFWVIFAILFSMTNAAMSMANDRWKIFYKLPKNSIDVLFMGNSHAYYTFQPQIMNEIVPIHSFIVGVDAENIVFSYYELREVLKTQKPKVVVLETFALDLDDTVKHGYLFQFLDASLWDENRTAITFRYLPLPTLYTIFPALRTRIDWSKPSQYFNEFITQFDFLKKKKISYQQSYTPQKKVISGSDYLAIKDLPTPIIRTPIPDNQIYLEKFYNLCKENNIQLIFTTAPIKKITKNLFSYYTPLDPKPFTKTNNIDWVTMDPSKFNHLHFIDPTHVDNFGSVIASIDMAMKLSQILGLPVNRDKLDYYNSFVFSDYSITNTGNDYTIELFPERREEPLEYKWVIKGSNDVILESGWSHESSYHFALSENGDYTVEVNIKNPSGDYVLNAVFSITKTD